MIILDADNRYVYIRGASRSVIRRLEKVTSYLVAGFMFSPAFRRRMWDGREHLLKFKTGDEGGYRAPVGLLGDIIKALDESGEEWKLDWKRRTPPPRRVKFGWNPDIKLRPYQLEAVSSIVRPGRWDNGRGILKMPIRSGKTKTAGRIIHELSVPTLFIVPSQMLLHQTRASLEEALQCEVGAIGDSEWTERDVTVATIQSLGRARGGERKVKGKLVKVPASPRYKAMVKAYGLVIFDEAHHLRGDVWHKVMVDFDSTYKIGLSATVFFDNERETEKGVIWLKACCGDIRAEVSTSRLIAEGYLMRPSIRLYRVMEPDLTGAKWSQTLRNQAIYENEGRNRKIVELCREQLDEGLKVLIVSNRLNQVAALSALLEAGGVDHTTITGNDDSDTRRQRVKDFVDGRVNVLMGTVFGEGVDIPEIECVINAEGGRDVKATVQRMRNLTPSKGKTEAVFIDFMDLTNAYFAEHSAERLSSYRSEEAFQIKLSG